jgi:hypothetical protein
MTDRNRSKTCALVSNDRGVSRREILRIGGAISAAGIFLPAWLTARAQTAPSSFTYYVSPTGSDSNAGTVASPWAITSLRVGSPNFSKLDGKGVSVGIMAGYYDCSSLVYNQESGGALQFPGGTSGTSNYFASCDASGNYSARAATLDMKGASGLFGGHVGGTGNYDGPLIAHDGIGGSVSGQVINYTVGNIVIDGLIIEGFSYKGIRVGGASSGDGPTITAPVTIQNCTFQNGGHNSGDSLDNAVALWLDGCAAATVQNCFFTNFAPWATSSADHLNAVICWRCTGTTIQYNTVTNSGNIYGKDVLNQGTTVRYNYVDVSMYTIESYGIQDFTGAGSSGLTQTSYFYGNVVLAKTYGISGWSNTDSSGTFTTPYQVYNNTIVMTGGTVGYYATAQGNGLGGLKFYNNIVTGSAPSDGFATSTGAPNLWDYNLYFPSGMRWGVFSNSSPQGGSTTLSSQSSFAAALTSVSGADSHSVAGTPTFANTGTYAQLYQLAAGSPGKGQGSTTGTPSGSATDMGAWGNGATQVGCNFSGSAPTTPIPSAPVLSVS